jgi:hypothetical protein
LVHGVAAAGMGPITIMANRPTAEPTSKSGRFIALSSLNPHPRGFASWRILLRDQALRKREPGFIRHPPDAGLAEAEFAAFDGFWQCQTLDTGFSCTQASDIGAPSAENVDFVVIQTHLSFGF